MSDRPLSERFRHRLASAPPPPAEATNDDLVEVASRAFLEHAVTSESHQPASTARPSERLRAAAQRLRKLGQAATPGPWTVWDRGVGWEINELPKVNDGTTFTQPDATWIAAVSPVLAEPLAAWLDMAAGLHEQATTVDDGNWTLRYALAVADAVVGDTEATHE